MEHSCDEEDSEEVVEEWLEYLSLLCRRQRWWRPAASLGMRCVQPLWRHSSYDGAHWRSAKHNSKQEEHMQIHEQQDSFTALNGAWTYVAMIARLLGCSAAANGGGCRGEVGRGRGFRRKKIFHGDSISCCFLSVSRMVSTVSPCWASAWPGSGELQWTSKIT